MKKIALLLALAVLLAAFPSCTAVRKRYTHTFTDVFDTASEFTVYCGSAADFKAAVEMVHGELLRLHRLFNIYEDGGAGSAYALNAGAGGDAMPVSEELFTVLAYGKQMASSTGGKLNIGMGAVLRLWHDCRLSGDRLPDAAALTTAAQHCDIEALLLKDGTACLTDAEMSLDLGAVAKGYAAEKAAALLREAGYDSFALNLGGNVVTVGEKPSGKWQIGIQNPDGGILTTVAVSNMAVVTSGDYQRYFTVDGVRYHHIINPDTGYPATGFRSVTVICEDSAMADALSTALFCLTREEGAALSTSLGAEALWMTVDGTVYRTEGFANYEK